MSYAGGHVGADVRSINSLNIIGAGERHIDIEVRHVHNGCYSRSNQSHIQRNVRRIVEPQLRDHLIQNEGAISRRSSRRSLALKRVRR